MSNKQIISQETTFVSFKRPGMAIPHGGGVAMPNPVQVENEVSSGMHGTLPEGRVAARFQKALQANAQHAQDGVGLHDFVENITEASGASRANLVHDRALKSEYVPKTPEAGAPLVRQPPPKGASPEEVRAHYRNPNSQVTDQTPRVGVEREQPQMRGATTSVHHIDDAGFPPQEEARQGVRIPDYVPPPAFHADEEGTSVELPSLFAFYEFKDLYVYTLRGKHLRKLARAHKENSLLQTAEVVSSVLRTSDPNYDGRPLAFDLTIPDFYWVLYYLRQNSFTKSNFTHRTRCTNPAHLELVREGKAAPESLLIEELIQKSSLVNNRLKALPSTDMSSLERDGIPYRPATIRDLVLIMDHPNFEEDDPEFMYASEIASYIGGGLSIQERIEIVDDLSPDQINAIKSYEEEVSNYGIDEMVTVHCKGCGASMKDRVSIDASTFLSAS